MLTELTWTTLPMEASNKTLRQQVELLARGSVRGLIVSGRHGISKTFTVKQTLKRLGIIPHYAKADGKVRRYRLVNPNSERGLVEAMMDPNCDIIIFDDCEKYYRSEPVLNVLKKATDSDKDRFISYDIKSQKKLPPIEFLFKGAIIILTNEPLRGVGANVHLAALLDRCALVEMPRSDEDVFNYSVKLCTHYGMLRGMGLKMTEAQEVLDFWCENKFRWQSVSVRLLTDIARFRKTEPAIWKTQFDEKMGDVLSGPAGVPAPRLLNSEDFLKEATIRKWVKGE